MKKWLVAVAVLVLVLVLGGFGCGGEGAPEGPDPEAATRMITDMAGRQVAVPETVETFVALGNTPRMITYLGLAEQAVGVGGMASDRINPVTAYAYVNQDRWKDLPPVGTDAAGATDYYPEQIIAADPDVILCTYSKELADEIQAKTGIPTVAVAMGTLFGKDYEEALRVLAGVCGVPERAEAVIAYINDCLADLDARTADVPEADKPSVLGAAATFKGAHGIEGVYAKYAVFAAVNARDVTRDMPTPQSAVIIDKEQVIGWNPDYIFFDSGGAGLVQQDYADYPAFYAHLRAVENGRLYQYPSSTSYFSNVEISIVNAYYVGGILFPDRFEDIVFAEKASEIFAFFLGDGDYLARLEASGFGYGQVTLGNR